MDALSLSFWTFIAFLNVVLRFDYRNWFICRSDWSFFRLVTNLCSDVSRVALILGLTHSNLSEMSVECLSLFNNVSQSLAWNVATPGPVHLSIVVHFLIALIWSCGILVCKYTACFSYRVWTPEAPWWESVCRLPEPFVFIAAPSLVLSPTDYIFLRSFDLGISSSQWNFWTLFGTLFHVPESREWTRQKVRELAGITLFVHLLLWVRDPVLSVV